MLQGWPAVTVRGDAEVRCGGVVVEAQWCMRGVNEVRGRRHMGAGEPGPSYALAGAAVGGTCCCLGIHLFRHCGVAGGDPHSAMGQARLWGLRSRGGGPGPDVAGGRSVVRRSGVFRADSQPGGGDSHGAARGATAGRSLGIAQHVRCSDVLGALVPQTSTVPPFFGLQRSSRRKSSPVSLCRQQWHSGFISLLGGVVVQPHSISTSDMLSRRNP